MGDINRAVDYISKHTNSNSVGLCARYVADALQHGGFKFTRQPSAYMYHTNGIIRDLRFNQIGRPDNPQKGDIYVQDRTDSHPDGHIALFDGRNWCSDFRQKTDNVYKNDAGTKYYYRLP